MATIFRDGVTGHEGLTRPGLRVRSAGVSGPAGVPVDPRTQAALGEADYTAPTDLSVVLTPEMIDKADLILTASRRHRTSVVRLRPDALARTFTVREFARYCLQYGDQVPSTERRATARLRAALTVAQSKRGLDIPARPEDDDIPDPVGKSLRFHRKSIKLIMDTAVPILAVVADDVAALSAHRDAQRTANQGRKIFGFVEALSSR